MRYGYYDWTLSHASRNFSVLHFSALLAHSAADADVDTASNARQHCFPIPIYASLAKLSHVHHLFTPHITLLQSSAKS